MAEFAGLAYYAEVPVVIFDIQRVGPSTGLPTRTAQSDVLSAAFLSHGDTRHILLFPASVEECFRLSMEAFDLAEEFQTPVFVMSDLDLGMNNWMAAPFASPQDSLRRGKILTEEELNQLKEFARYQDVDGDGIPYRTLPGNRHPLAAYFTRGSGHDEKAQYTERPEDYTRNMNRLARKYETARRRVPGPVVDFNPKAEVGLVAFGSSHWALVEARDRLRSRHSLETSYLRLRAFPLSDEVEKFVRAHNRVYVVEQNRDGQVHDLIRLEIDPREVVKLRSVRHYDGLPITARTIVKQVMEQEDISEGVDR
jgi:2-oxoglutarate ferredoxin oxidoreductase subunit alpha